MSNARFGLRTRTGESSDILQSLTAADEDALAFINAAGITNLIQQDAIIRLTVNLKLYNLWTKMKAIYPFVGGTATTHKYNLKDPRDLDAAFRLVFNGGWTHSSTGALPNGTTGYADTFFNQQGSWTSTSNGAMGIYLRSNTNNSGCDMGAGTIISGANSSTIYSRFTDILYAGLNCTAVTPGNSNTDSRGFFAVSRTNLSNYSVYKRGTSTITATNTDAIGSNANQKIYIGAGNNSGSASNYCDREFAFAFLSDGLNSTEVDDLYTAVLAYQTTLSRNV